MTGAAEPGVQYYVENGRFHNNKLYGPLEWQLWQKPLQY